MKRSEYCRNLKNLIIQAHIELLEESVKQTKKLIKDVRRVERRKTPRTI